MNAKKIESLRNSIQQVTTMIANAEEPLISMLLKQRETMEAELAALSPAKDVASEIEEVVLEKAKSADTSVSIRSVFEDLDPSVAMRALHGAARATTGHLLFLDTAHRNILARQAMSSATATGWRRPLDAESTSPMDKTEDELFKIGEQTRDCLAILAVLLKVHNICRREAERRGNAISDFEEFPDTARLVREREANRLTNAAKRRADAAILRDLTPSVISMAK